MSTTTNLGLFKHDNVSTNENSFDIEKALNENFDKIDEAQGRNNSRLQILENDNTTNKQDIVNIKTKNTEQDTKIQTNTTDIANIQKEQTTQNTNISKNTTDIITIKQEQTTQNTNIKALQDDNEVNKTDIANIKVKNEEQDTYIEELETENARLRKDLDALPSVPASGEYIHVEDSAESRFKSFKIGGNSKQETREGYNLVGVNDTESTTNNGITFGAKDEIISLDGTNNLSYAINYITLKHNLSSETKTYKFKIIPISGSFDSGYIGLSFKDSSDTQIAYMQNTSSNLSTSKEMDLTNTSKVQLFATSNATFSNFKFKILLTEGTEDKEWEAYGETPSLEFESEVQTVKDSANVTICNKNLLKITAKNTTIGGITYKVNEDSTVSATGTSTGAYLDLCMVNLRPGTYTFSGGPANGESQAQRLSIYDISDGVTKTLKTLYGDITYTVTFDKETKIKMTYVVQNGATVNEEIVKPMIELGSVASKFVEHREQTFTIPVQQEMLKIGDYADTFIKKDGIWYERHYIARKIFDGTENISNWWSTTNYYGFGYNPTGIMNNINNQFSNKFLISSNSFKIVRQWDINNSTYEGNAISLWETGNVIYGRINKAKIGGTESSSEDELKALLKTYFKSKYEEDKPIYIDYILAEPNDIECTEEQKVVLDEIKKTAQSYKNITNIFSTNELSPIFEVEYRKDLELEHTKMQSQIDEIKELLSSTATSAMLLDNMQTDLESEVS